MPRDSRIPSDPNQLVHGHIDNISFRHWKLYVVVIYWGEKRFGPWYTFKPAKAIDIAQDQTHYVRLLKNEVLSAQ